MKRNTLNMMALITILGVGLTGAALLTSASVMAEDVFCADLANNPEAYKAMGCDGKEDKIKEVITNLLSIIIGASGLVAIIFVVIGGVNYMTSMGDAGKIAKARNTILYALIGLVVCALAFAIVNFAANMLNNKGATINQSEV